MEWISVNDRLPEDICNCLVYYIEDWNSDKNKKIGWAFFNSDKKFCLENYEVEPTHWMPLPEPPNKKRKLDMKKIRPIRINRQITLDVMGQFLGASPLQVSQSERNEFEFWVDNEQLYDLALFLKCSIQDLV
jgi:hypothetical protein